MRTELLGLELEKGQSAEEVIRLKLRIRIADMFNKSGSMNLIQQIRDKKEEGKGPFIILLLGINGTGKTTTIAKIARLFKKNGISTVPAAADTHRAGAIEQTIATWRKFVYQSDLAEIWSRSVCCRT